MLYLVSVKQRYNGSNVRIEPGMSVQIPSNSMCSPLMSSDGKRAIADAFMRIYGIDLSRISSVISTSYMMCERIG